MKKRHILAGLLLSGLVVSTATACKDEEIPEIKETFEFKGISSESTAKLEYNVGEFVDVSDVVLKAIYTSSKTGLDSVSTVTNFTISVKDASGNVVTRFDSVGTYTLTVTFEGETKDFTINVTKKEFTDVSEAISYAEAKDSLVNGGTASTKYIYSADPTAEPGYTVDCSFSLGNDFMVVNSGEGESASQLVYSLDNKKNAFAVLVTGTGDDKTVSKYNYNVEKENVKGISVDIFGDSVNDGYGAAEIVKNLSEYGKEFGFDYNSAVKTVEGKTVYSYSFKSIETLWGTDYAYTINVEFTLGLFGNIESAKVTEVRYYDAVIADDKKSFTLPTLADGEAYEGQARIYEMTQTVGEKATDNEYLYSHLAVENFKVMNGDVEVKDGDVINVDLDNGNLEVDGLHRQQYAFTISDYTPTTANPDIDKVIVELNGTAYDGTEVSQSSDEWNFDYTYVNVYNETITFYTAGSYTVTFSSGSTTKTITINVTPETPSEIGIKTYEDLNEKSDFVDSTGAYTMYKSNVLYLAPSIAAKLDQACVVSLPDGTTGAALLEETVKDVKAYKFTATAAGTYTVTFAAKEDSTVTSTITITVLENPDVADMLAGTYYTLIGSDIATVVFGEDGRVTITVNEQSQSFAFRYENNEIVLTDPQGESLNYNIVVNSKYELQLVDADNNKYTLSTEVPTVSEFELAGEYSVSLMGGMAVYTLTFEATNSTTGVMTLNTGNKTGKYDYVYTPSTGEIALTVQADSSDYLGTATVEVVDDALVYNFNGTAYTCTKTGGGSTGGEETGELVAPTKMIGTWDYTINDVTTTIVITETILTANNYDYELTSISNGVYTFTDVTSDSYTYEVVLNEDGTITATDYAYGYAGMTQTYEKRGISSSIIGTWDFTSKGGVTTTLVITKDTLVYDGEYTYEFTSEANGVYTLTDVTSDSYTYEISLNEDGTLTGIDYTDGEAGMSIIFTKRAASEEMIGTWDFTSKGGVTTTLVITETTLVVDGEYTYEITSVVNGVYTFTDVTSDSYTYEVVLNEDGTITATDYSNGEAGMSITFIKRAVSKDIIGA